MRREIGAFVVAAGAGFIAGRLLGAPTAVDGALGGPLAVSSEPSPVAGDAPSGCPGEDALFAELTRLDAARSAVEAVLAEEVARAEVEVGAPLDWPDGASEAFTEGGVERGLQGVIDRAGVGVLHDLDCGEYPCVAVLTVSGPDAFAQAAALREALKGSVYGETAWRNESMTGPPGEPVLRLHVALPEGPMAGLSQRRMSFRLEESTAAP